MQRSNAPTRAREWNEEINGNCQAPVKKRAFTKPYPPKKLIKYSCQTMETWSKCRRFCSPNEDDNIFGVLPFSFFFCFQFCFSSFYFGCCVFVFFIFNLIFIFWYEIRFWGCFLVVKPKWWYNLIWLLPCFSECLFCHPFLFCSATAIAAAHILPIAIEMELKLWNWYGCRQNKLNYGIRWPNALLCVSPHQCHATPRHIAIPSSP